MRPSDGDKPSSRIDVVERARRYVSKMPPAVSGENGHNACFKVACRLVIGFALPAETALLVLRDVYNPKCQPPFTDAELLHKINQASKQKGDRGYLAGDDDPAPWEKNGSHKPESEPKTSGALGILGSLMGKLRDGVGDILYQAPDPFDGFECGPEKITVVGAPPGAGKTALVMQYVFGLLEADSEARVMVANAEMTMEVLLRRELTRRSGIPGRAIRFADVTDSQLEKVEQSAIELMPLLDRIDYLEPPYNQETLASLWSKPGDGRLLVIDYLQKFARGDDPRIAVNEVMGTLRTLAHGGWGVMALSSVTRVKKAEELSMSSFKESGEIEFNADACYLLRDNGESGSDEMVRDMKLDCVKNRHGEMTSIPLIFDKPHMTFSGPVKPFDLGWDNDGAEEDF